MTEQTYHPKSKVLHIDRLCRKIIETSNLGILVTDEKGYLLYTNTIAREKLNITDQDRDKSLNISDLNPATLSDYMDIVKTGKPQFNKPFSMRDHTYVAHRLPLVEQGKIIGISCFFQDIEPYERLVKDYHEIQEYADEVQAIIESSYDGIFVTDGDANTIRVNSAYENMTGIRGSEVIGRNMRDLVAEGFYSESCTLKVLATGKTETLNQVLKSGKTILVTGNPIFDGDGNIKMVVTNVRDMTDLVELNRRLEDSLEMTSAYKKKLQYLQRASTMSKDLILVSESMLQIYEVVERVSKTNATVILYGETGVGKDRIAEEIHSKSDRARSGIIVKINCGAIPESLLESELFGYESGAFTGARKDGKAGLFEVAHGGTLFLDEVESMPAVVQSKLLRVLQNFEITRVGSTSPKKVDVRLICASNQDLNELVARKEFRSDLYYRLNVIPIHIPPLRERQDDIPYLLSLFLTQFCKKHGKKKVISNDALQMLLKYPWPGNVREVANVIERLVVVTPGDYIYPRHLPQDLSSSTDLEEIASGVTLKEHMEQLEVSIIRNMIKRYGSARKAAPHLGTDASTLTRKLKKVVLR